MYKTCLNVLSTLSIVLFAASCKTVTSPRYVHPDTPIAYELVSEMVDEETLEHTVKFRNIGNTVLSFDYTIVDEPGVPHIDCLGPNSGLVENLYPGAEVQMKNPLESMKDVYVTLGKVTYGKKTGDQLAGIYKPGTLQAPGASPAASPLPILEPVLVPGE